MASTKVGANLEMVDPLDREASPSYYSKMRMPFNLWFSARSWQNGASDTGGQPVAGNPEPPVLLRLWYNDIPHFMVDNTTCDSYIDVSYSTYSLVGFVQLSRAVVESIRALNAAMWCLAGMTCALSLVWCMLGDPQQHLRFDLMCFSAALLFALPQMRGLLPAIPAAGTQYDVLNVFGQLWLIVASIVFQTLKCCVGGPWRVCAPPAQRWEPATTAVQAGGCCRCISVTLVQLGAESHLRPLSWPGVVKMFVCVLHFVC